MLTTLSQRLHIFITSVYTNYWISYEFAHRCFLFSIYVLIVFIRFVGAYIYCIALRLFTNKPYRLSKNNSNSHFTHDRFSLYIRGSFYIIFFFLWLHKRSFKSFVKTTLTIYVPLSSANPSPFITPWKLQIAPYTLSINLCFAWPCTHHYCMQSCPANTHLLFPVAILWQLR